MTPGAEQIVAAIHKWRAESQPLLVVAIDGYGGSGKTTIAREVAVTLEAPIVETDRYYDNTRRNADVRPMGRYYDWEALRRESLGPSISTGARLILVEGVSSAAPALADMVTRAVFVATPEPIRLERLHNRLTPEEWDEEWLAEERAYFASRMPESFDLVVPGCTEGAADPRILS